MKLKKATTALVLALALFGAFNLVSYAANGLQEIKAYLNSGITIKLDGEEKVITDASGVRTYPISYNGTTYLPVRSIANLLGIEVGWDQATASVLLGKQPSGIDLIDTYKHYQRDDVWEGWAHQYQTGDGSTMAISGIDCSKWISLCRRGYCGYPETITSISFNLGGKHDTLTFSYFADYDATLQVLGDNGNVLFEKGVTGGQVAQTVTIPLFKTSQLTFQITDVGSREPETTAYIFDAYLDAEQ